MLSIMMRSLTLMKFVNLTMKIHIQSLNSHAALSWRIKMFFESVSSKLSCTNLTAVLLLIKIKHCAFKMTWSQQIFHNIQNLQCFLNVHLWRVILQSKARCLWNFNHIFIFRSLLSDFCFINFRSKKYDVNRTSFNVCFWVCSMILVCKDMLMRL